MGNDPSMPSMPGGPGCLPWDAPADECSFCCSSKAGKQCSRCKTKYCSRECQRRDWKEGGHNIECKGLGLVNSDATGGGEATALFARGMSLMIGKVFDPMSLSISQEACDALEDGPQDREEGQRLIREAAAKGSKAAMFSVALECKYEKGDGEASVAWIKKAASQGHAEAERTLGGICWDEGSRPDERITVKGAAAKDGCGPRDPVAAARWLLRAIKHGVSESGPDPMGDKLSAKAHQETCQLLSMVGRRLYLQGYGNGPVGGDPDPKWRAWIRLGAMCGNRSAQHCIVTGGLRQEEMKKSAERWEKGDDGGVVDMCKASVVEVEAIKDKDRATRMAHIKVLNEKLKDKIGAEHFHDILNQVSPEVKEVVEEAMNSEVDTSTTTEEANTPPAEPAGSESGNTRDDDDTGLEASVSSINISKE